MSHIKTYCFAFVTSRQPALIASAAVTTSTGMLTVDPSPIINPTKLNLFCACVKNSAVSAVKDRGRRQWRESALQIESGNSSTVLSESDN